MRSRWGKRLVGDSGSVTAEFAVALPAVVLVLACCLGAVQVVAQQVRMTDAAADAARSLARGDDPARAARLVRHSLGSAELQTHRSGEFLCAQVTAPSAFAPFAVLGLTLEARSCALAGGL